MESLRNKSPMNMMKTIKKASPAPPRGGGTSIKKSPATIKAVTRFLDSASTVVWEGVKEGANLTNVVATKMSQTVVKNDAQRDHYNRGSDGGMTRTHSSPITTHRNNSKSTSADGGGGGGVKERIKIFNSTTTATPPKKNSRSHTSSMSDNNNSPYQRRMGGGVSGEQRRREYEASIPLPTPIPLPVRCSTGMATNSHSSPYVRDERGGGGGSDGNGNKRRDNRRSPTAVSASTTTTTTMNNGRYNNRRHDHYEKENDTNSTTATTTSNSKRMYHAGLDNFVSVLKSSSPKKLRKQNEVNKAKEEEGEGRSTHHCQPKDCHNNDKRVSKNKNGWRHDDDDDHGTDEKQLSSGANNYENHADNDTAKARQDQCINIRVMKKNKCDNGISPIKPWQDDAYLAISSDANDSHSVTMEGNNDNNYDSSSSSKMKKKKQRMGVNNNYTSSIPYTSDMRYQHHSLIQIPLQRHIMAVHESACSNATCTVMKEPFPLVLLSSSRQVGEEDDDHLDVLGAIAGHGSINNSVIGNNDNRIKKDGNNDNDKKIALDLLTSAAFLFKTSRRKIL